MSTWQMFVIIVCPPICLFVLSCVDAVLESYFAEKQRRSRERYALRMAEYKAKLIKGEQ